ncbi:hypothetical protein [Pelosinus sp. UFO1]|nr:hypothetical protein [Pelosinus sp. UFO1]AIF51023.1 hypothetical protein UFO1_1470 [Pelosinus sp. UFO1]
MEEQTKDLEAKDKAGFQCLEDPSIDLNTLEEKERLSVAMSSYYILYR